MKERPILFSAPMVLAILEGHKTQTRRVVKPQPPEFSHATRQHQRILVPRCPYGQPGDRLWVRETIFAYGRWETRFSAKKGRDEWRFLDMTLERGKQYRYPASMAGDNGPRQRGGVTPQWWKRPAIHAPRAASRILLEVVAIRVERLMDITEDDALAEGVMPLNDLGAIFAPAVSAYSDLWESINGPGSWGANPWVWCISFQRITT